MLFRSGQTIASTIVVAGFSKEAQSKIALNGSIQVGALLMGGSSVITSRNEDTWESVAPQMQQDAEDQLGREKFRGRHRR